MADTQYLNEKGNPTKRNRTLAALACLILPAVTAVGCGKVEEPIPVDLSSGNMEELQEENARDAAAAGETEQSETENGNFESDAPGNEQPDDEGGSRAAQDCAQSYNEQRTQAVGSAELAGTVYSLSQDSIVMSSFE